MLSFAKKIKIIKVESEIESLLLEAQYIKRYAPKYNVDLKDGKAYPLINITTSEKFPKVLMVRKIDDTKATYFGPFPNTSDMKMVLKMARKIFPFQSVRIHQKKICLYNHLGLCPCPVTLTNEVLIKDYRKNIRHLIGFLSGKTKSVLHELAKEREKHSKKEDYEQAGIFQKKIDAITLITASVRHPFEYEQNPNLKEDVRNKELEDLRNILAKNNVKIKKLSRIECYDISTISGVHSVGSMVAFTDGEKDSSQYRRFKIRKEEKTGEPNDFAMMREVLERRINHPEWRVPDLIVVDGGKGQVNVAKQVIVQNNLKISLIGLAKREEIIITSDFREIRLPRNCSALKLIMRIRDEAHRFAITYHRKVRSRAVLL